MSTPPLPTAGPGLAKLIRDLDDAVRLSGAKERCAGVKAALTAAASAGASLLPEPCRRPCPDSYARHLLHRDPGGAYSVVVMVWGPAQGTPLHDHDGRWCVECVYRGRILVTSYSIQEEVEGDVFRFREESAIRAELGEAGALIPPHEYHEIVNAGDGPAITVHVYEGEMTSCNTYEPVGGGLYRRTERPLAYDD